MRKVAPGLLCLGRLPMSQRHGGCSLQTLRLSASQCSEESTRRSRNRRTFFWVVVVDEYTLSDRVKLQRWEFFPTQRKLWHLASFTYKTWPEQNFQAMESLRADVDDFSAQISFRIIVQRNVTTFLSEVGLSDMLAVRQSVSWSMPMDGRATHLHQILEMPVLLPEACWVQTARGGGTNHRKHNRHCDIPVTTDLVPVTPTAYSSRRAARKRTADKAE